MMRSQEQTILLASMQCHLLISSSSNQDIFSNHSMEIRGSWRGDMVIKVWSSFSFFFFSFSFLFLSFFLSFSLVFL